MKNTWRAYTKAFVAAAGVVLSAVLVAFVGDGAMSFNEFVNVVVLGTGAVSVAVAPNTPGAKYAKAILAALATAATALLSVYSGGISPAEWAQIGVAVATTLGVYQAPNRGDEFDRFRLGVRV